MEKFKVVSPFEPSGDQGQAIEIISNALLDREQALTLKGVTGSGKTYTMAKIVEKVQKPTLIISHNKTLAAQLYREFQDFFPHNAVEYFVSYYDYYQPEAYVPARDLYIEKDSSINDEIDRMRLSRHHESDGTAGCSYCFPPFPVFTDWEIPHLTKI